MDLPKGVFDSFRVEEAYNWRDDVMEITRRIVHETDDWRLNNIAEHFNVDLSEIREFLEMKRKKMQKPKTNGDRIRSMTDEEMAEWFGGSESFCPPGYYETRDCDACPEICAGHWMAWLKQEVSDDKL